MNTANISMQKSQIETRLKTLTNPVLKEILNHYGLPKVGVKAILQNRLIGHLNEAIQHNNLRQFEEIRYMVTNGGKRPPPSSHAATSNSATPVNHSPHGHAASSYGGRPSLAPLGGQRNYGSTTRLSFKPSAFYHIEQSMTPVVDLPEMPSNRHTISHGLALSPTHVEQLKSDSSLRIMLYCATSTLLTNYERVDVAFPNQLEVRVNQEEVKSNYKGLKNKPGTTKPADITEFVRKLAGYQNQLQITYALTTKKFSFVVNLVRKSSVEQLTERIRTGKMISKDHVLREMKRQAEDQDIEVESTIMSLKDPISTLRISLPCRSTVCAHNQCFDAMCFIQLQEQAPTWTCPICNKSVSYEALVIDQYFQDILQQTEHSISKVTIEPNGVWHKIVEGDENSKTPNRGRAAYDNDSDDDIVEIPDGDTRVTQIKREAPSMTPAFVQTPPLSSREPSISNLTRPSNVQSSGAKRPSSTVVDLTLSDDEDEPPRPAKRTFVSGPPPPPPPPPQSAPASRPDSRASVPRFGSVSQPNHVFGRIELPRPAQMPPAGYGQSPPLPNGTFGSSARLPFPNPNYPFSNGGYQGTNSPFGSNHNPT